jgi:hypothetical protein
VRCSRRCASPSFPRRAARRGAPRAPRSIPGSTLRSLLAVRDVVAGREDRRALPRRRISPVSGSIFGHRVDLVAEELDPDRAVPVVAGKISTTSPAPGRCRGGSRALRWYWISTSAAAARPGRSPRPCAGDRHAAVGVRAIRGRRCRRRWPRSPRRRRSRARPWPSAHAVDLVVDRGVLLDVGVAAGDVGLGLVVVVVADEVLDRVLGEEVPELGRAGRPASCWARARGWAAARTARAAPS